MKHRRSVDRLALAVSLVLTATAGPALAAGPAAALPAADGGGAGAAVWQEPTRPFVLAGDAQLWAGSPSGFVTYAAPAGSTKYTYRWHRSADGVTTTLPASSDGAFPGVALDSGRVVVRTQENVYRILDMAGGAPVDLDASSVAADRNFKLLLQDTLVFWRTDAGGEGLRLLSKPAGTTVQRQVTGLPAGMKVKRLAYSLPGTLAIHYQVAVGDASEERLAVIDLAEAKVIEDRVLPGAQGVSDLAVSSTHLAWIEQELTGASTLVTARRGTRETTRHTALSSAYSTQIGLLGDWVVYGTPEKALSAVSLTDGTIISLLKDMKTLVGADQGLLAQGTTPELGRGVYRIGTGPDGLPAAVLLATNGVTTPTTVVTHQAPATAGFRAVGDKAVLRWVYGRSDLQVNLRVTHKQTGRTWTADQTLLGTDTEAVFDWDGTFTNGTAAYNGAYEWKMIAFPLSNIGGAVERTGFLTVASGSAMHDYSDSNSPDLLVRTGQGHLVSYDVRQILGPPGADWEPTERGGGWQIYDRLLSAGNLDAPPHSDILARDTSGVLWLYPSTGHLLAKRIPVGGGWNRYDKLAAGSDLTGDGRPDLIATDHSGVLWLYKATGSATKPFAPRKRVGGGWGTYNLLTAPGNLGGAKAGDLLARDRSGVLWLYLGKGDGTFAPRTKVGGGWGVYGQIVNIGDTDRDGHPDLIADSGNSGYSWLTVYKGTGDWRVPFRPGRLPDHVAPYSRPYSPQPLPF
ncbi:FG-GAP-like repeat-containing protein [Streptomyces sp. NPDC050842]|uniref:FG-GAP-like repeat-containing protein n=1 Tax=Streptomyces sp. NPDC050842 TaxID=3365636 RepID=UPI0037B9442C